MRLSDRQWETLVRRVDLLAIDIVGKGYTTIAEEARDNDCIILHVYRDEEHPTLDDEPYLDMFCALAQGNDV